MIKKIAFSVILIFFAMSAVDAYYDPERTPIPTIITMAVMAYAFGDTFSRKVDGDNR